jgi:hypothetical protein
MEPVQRHVQTYDIAKPFARQCGDSCFVAVRRDLFVLKLHNLWRPNAKVTSRIEEVNENFRKDSVSAPAWVAKWRALSQIGAAR